jgi:hypothetical protein
VLVSNPKLKYGPASGAKNTQAPSAIKSTAGTSTAIGRRATRFCVCVVIDQPPIWRPGSGPPGIDALAPEMVPTGAEI